MRKILIFSFILLVFGISAYAHQPRLVFYSTDITVNNPEISQAFYGELGGFSAVYRINSDKPFKLYVGVLVPKINGVLTDFSVEIKKDGEILSLLDGTDYNWTEFYESFAGDYYLQGPEFKKDADAGRYELKVYNPDNSGKYVLAVGEKEEFPVSEIAKTFKSLPYLKTDFFGKPIYSVLFNKIGTFFVIFLALLIIIFEVYHFIKKIRSRKL